MTYDLATSSVNHCTECDLRSPYAVLKSRSCAFRRSTPSNSIVASKYLSSSSSSSSLCNRQQRKLVNWGSDGLRHCHLPPSHPFRHPARIRLLLPGKEEGAAGCPRRRRIAGLRRPLAASGSRSLLSSDPSEEAGRPRRCLRTASRQCMLKKISRVKR